MNETAAYGAGFAALYDLFHGSKDYRAEARFIRETADAILGTKGQTLRVLDLACGTASHGIALSRMRCDVTGVDMSSEMLARARQKARAARRSIRFEQQDLARLALPRQFDVVTCLFDSLGYLRTNARIAQALRRMRRVTRPGGVLVIEVWHAAAMLGGFDPLRVRRVRGGGLEAVRIGETRLRDHLAEVRYEIFSRKGGGSWRRFLETHVNRFFSAGEITAFVTAAGFEVRRVLGGFDDACPPADDAWHLVVVAQQGT